MTFWQKVGRWWASLSGGLNHSPEVDPARVDAAIRLIQSTIEDQQREQRVRQLRVVELNETRQEQLTAKLRTLLSPTDSRNSDASNRPTADSA